MCVCVRVAGRGGGGVCGKKGNKTTVKNSARRGRKQYIQTKKKVIHTWCIKKIIVYM